MIKAILSMGSNVTPINFDVTKRNQRKRVKEEHPHLLATSGGNRFSS